MKTDYNELKKEFNKNMVMHISRHLLAKLKNDIANAVLYAADKWQAVEKHVLKL